MTSSTKEIIIKVLAVAFVLPFISSKIECKAKNDSKSECMTPECQRAASGILKMIDTKVDPCDNFYYFACGKFMKETVIPKDKDSVAVWSFIEDDLQQKLKIIIEGKSPPNEPKAFKETKNYYKACMNHALIEKMGRKPLLESIKSLGGWPVLDGNTWQDKIFDWKQAVYKRRKFGYSVEPFFALGIEMDSKNNSKKVIYIDQVPLGLDREYLVKGTKDKIVDAYYRYMVDTAVLLGADKARAQKELKESLEFEIKLAIISIPPEKRRNPNELYNPMSIKKLSEKYKSIPWKEYINTAFKPKFKIDENEIVIVKIPSYFDKFEKLINQTPKKTQANYNIWRAVDDSMDLLPDNIRNRQMQYLSVLSGQTERKPRWQECMGFICDNFGLSVGALYVRKFFGKEAKKDALEMVVDIQQEFQEILKTVDWMDEKTRSMALDKAKSMVNHVGYPDELLDDKKLDEFYEELEIKEDDYFMANIKLSIFQMDVYIENYRKPVNKSDWVNHGYSAVVNAFYSRFENSLMFPAGNLQGSYFNKERPKFMNYGALGYAIGHETTHGFDDQGRQFDKNGNMIDWWQPVTKAKFLSKAQCIIDQYSNYTVKGAGLKLNGVNTQGENIADNGGAKISYLAYQKWVAKHGTEPKLPNLNYSPSQLFWISAGNSWCKKQRPESIKESVLTDTHSPEEFRIVGPFSNRPEFATDFNCPVGSKMNPKKKCSVW